MPDVFASLPTGSRKSLCYWNLPHLFDALYKGKEVSIVLLIAFMKDQVQALPERGVSAKTVTFDKLRSPFVHSSGCLYVSH